MSAEGPGDKGTVRAKQTLRVSSVHKQMWRKILCKSVVGFF